MMEIGTVSDFKQTLTKGNWKIFGIGGLPETRSEAHFIATDFELICSKKTSELESVAKIIKVKVFDIENNSKKGETILSNKRVIEYINASSKGKNVAIYLFKSSFRIEKICAENGWKLIADKSVLFDKLDSRNFFFGILEKINCSRNFEILWSDQVLNKSSQLFKKFGEKIIIQTFSSAGGKGTFFVKKNNIKEVLNEFISGERQKIVVTSFVEGFDVAITGCVTDKNGVLAGWARYQFVGVESIVAGKEHSKHSFCGNDWQLNSKYSKEIQKQGEEFVQKIGNILKEEGFRGIFGIDFIYDEKNKKLIPLEINPRLIGSFPIETQFEILNQQLPLIGFHFLEFLKIEYKISENLKLRQRKKLIKKCSHMMLANFLECDIIFKKSLRSGVYCIEDKKLNFIREGFQANDIEEPEYEFVLSAGVPSSGNRYKKNNQLFRIIWQKSIQTDNGRDVSVEAKNTIRIIKEEIKGMIAN